MVRWIPCGAIAATFALAAGSAVAGVVPPPPGGPSAGGRLAWAHGGEGVDLVGDTWVGLPLPLGERDSLYLSLATRLDLGRPDQFTFEVHDLQYDLDIGWRHETGRRWRLTAFAGQRGRERVDADGQAFVQYAALGVESAPARPHRRFEGSVAFGPVFKEREVRRADLVVRALARIGLGSAPGLGRATWSFDFELDGVVVTGDLEADVALGPRLRVPIAPGLGASIFVHHETAHHPLGSGQSLWLFGLAYEEGPEAPEADVGPPVGVDGALAFGGGEGRLTGQLLVRLLSPAFRGRWRGMIDLDGNILTAEDTGELFYLYDLGIERMARGWAAGGYFHHRSNHRLAEPGDRVTSINVLELGIESEDWTRPPRRTPARRLGLLDARARLGYLVDSSFGEDRRWHARRRALVASRTEEPPGAVRRG